MSLTDKLFEWRELITYRLRGSMSRRSRIQCSSYRAGNTNPWQRYCSTLYIYSYMYKIQSIRHFVMSLARGWPKMTPSSSQRVWFFLSCLHTRELKELRLPLLYTLHSDVIVYRLLSLVSGAVQWHHGGTSPNVVTETYDIVFRIRRRILKTVDLLYQNVFITRIHRPYIKYYIIQRYKWASLIYLKLLKKCENK